MKKGIFLILLILTFQGAFAEDSPGQDATSFYDSEFVKVNYSMFGGLSLGYRGSNYGFFMGLDGTLADQLKTEAPSKSLVRSYQMKNLIGNLFLWGGLFGTVAGEYMYIESVKNTYANDTYYTTSTKSPDMTGLYIAGFCSLAMMVSPFVLNSSFEDLVNAANAYDRSIMKKLP